MLPVHCIHFGTFPSTELEICLLTDIIEHKIPTRSTAKPKACNPQLYSEKERAYQDTFLRELLDANIITRITSPWSAKTKFIPEKESGNMRVVHSVVPINDATIKDACTMKRVEPILG